MREFFLKLFSEKNSDMSITLYSWWHIFYLLLIFGSAIAFWLIFRKRSDRAKNIVLSVFAYLTIGLYLADFMIMPLSDSYSGISVYKLPFNICTLMAVFVPFAQFNKKFGKVKHVIVMLGMVSSLMWMVYPGSALNGQPPFSYIVFQTFMYHGVLFIWAFLSLAFGKVKFSIKNCWHDLIAILLILGWAWFGNTVYGGGYNWFFIETSIFPFLPDYIMPLVVVVAVFGMCMLMYGLYYAVLAIVSKIHKNKNVAEVSQVPQEETAETVDKNK